MVNQTSSSALCSIWGGCCSNKAVSSDIVDHYTVICFDETDTEVRDLKVKPSTSWSDFQLCISEG